MGRKAVSQVDFAIASGLFVLIFAFLVLFSTNYFSTMKNDATIIEKRGFALSMMKDIMSEGEPSNWHFLIKTFGNNTAANWSRSLSRSSNATISQFSSGELGTSFDSSYAIVDNSANADTLEATFPYVGIPQNAAIGLSSFTLLYNASEFSREFGEGDYKDDFSYIGIYGTYLDDWGVENMENQLVWWNSNDYFSRLNYIPDANNLILRLYYKPSSAGICYFDSLNFTINYSYYPYYPRKIGLSSDSYKMEVLLNNTIGDLANENVTINFNDIGYQDADMNSVVVYNESGYPVNCNINGKTMTFSTQISNQTQKWFSVWFSKNSTSNFSSPACSYAVTGENNLTTGNRNETILPAHRNSVIQYSKLSALNRSVYTIMKSLSDQKYDFHISLTGLSGQSIIEYGDIVPTTGDVNAIQRSVVYQNSSAGINSGFLYVYMW